MDANGWTETKFAVECKSPVKTLIVIVALFITAYLILMPALARSQRRAYARNTMSALLSVYYAGDTNEFRHRHIFNYTNRYVIDGTNYQCVLAVDSWDYQGMSNLLILATNRNFLYVSQHGIMPINGLPPGY